MELGWLDTPVTLVTVSVCGTVLQAVFYIDINGQFNFITIIGIGATFVVQLLHLWQC